MRSVIKMGVVLMLFCSIAAGLLYFVYEKTQAQITKNEIVESEKKRKIVVPNATHFEEKKSGEDTYYIGLDDSNNVSGTVIIAEPRGYGGPIKITIGIGNDDSITAIEFTKLDQSETPGLGVKTTLPKFKDQFKGKKVGSLKLRKEGGEIDAVTAATISSRAVTNGVREAVEKYLSKK